jgi:hypothetical protein
MDSPCIEAPGARNKDGYCQTTFDGKQSLAHRVAYCKHHGIPIESIKGLVVRHHCDNPPCINPEHLEIGTHADNMRDMYSRGRRAAARGEANGRAVLTEAQVHQLRAEYVKGSPTHGTLALAKKYGIGKSQAHNIIKGLQWTP